MSLMTEKIRREDIRNVVVVLAGSRTGSSFLFNGLKSLGNFISPTGEETPLYRKAGFGNFSGLSYSDRIEDPLSEQQVAKAAEFLLTDVNEAPLLESFLFRASLQWPALHQGSALNCAKTLPTTGHWPQLYHSFIQKLQDAGLPVSLEPFRTDGEHPLHLPLLEEPPYITPEIKRSVNRDSLLNTPLLLKTSTNIYRTPLLRALFPQAKFRWILLQRNPAATINALMDGWLSSAFHSHDVSKSTRLRIQGYSDVIPGGERFWKFDMPDGWLGFTDSTLAEVCAFQWQSAYSEMEKFESESKDPILRVSYEDLLNEKSRTLMLEQILDFSGTTALPNAEWNPTKAVASVHAPLHGRWKLREHTISEVVKQNKDLSEISKRAGYLPEQMEAWP